jgi:hypothetical protein
MKASNLVANTGVPDVADGSQGLRRWGLTGNRRYWYMVETEGAVVKGHFTTVGMATNPAFAAVLKPNSS